jgi:trans-aconitate methyltransferase
VGARDNLSACATVGRMALTDWDHNARYHRLLLAQVPADAQWVLDLGCGAGALARDLACRVAHVEGVDRSPAMIAAARLAAPRATLHLADVMSVDLPEGAYDAVLSSAVLHHLPLPQALSRMASWLVSSATSPPTRRCRSPTGR